MLLTIPKKIKEFMINQKAWLKTTRTSLFVLFSLLSSLVQVVHSSPSQAAATTVPINSGSNPYGMASDSFGNTYVVNNGSNSVTKIKPNGTTQTISVGSLPFDVAIDSTGNAFVTNYNSASVTKIKPDGTTVTISAVGANPYGITVDGSGNVYCTVGNGGAITKIANASTSDTPVVTTGWASTTATTGREMLYDGSGYIYAVGRGSGTVVKINVSTAAFTSYTVVSSGSYNPYGIAMDPVSKNIYVTIDFGTGGPGANAGSITKITPAGVVTLNWAATPSYPLSIAVDGSGNVYSANGAGTVTKVTSTGTASTFLTIGSYPTVQPTGIAIDSQGNILIGDNASGGSGAISKYIQPPVFTFSSSSETVNPGTAITGYTITNTSSFPDSYTVTPSVTNGLSFSTSTGLISGTPTAVASVVTYTISGTNAAGTATATYSLTVSATPVVTTSATPAATPEVVCMVNQLTCHDAAELLGALATVIGTTENGLNAITKKVLQKKLKPKKIKKASK